MSRSEAAVPLPPLWRGTRRRYLVWLALAGLGQAAAAGAGAHVLASQLKTSSAGGRFGLLFGVLAAAALAVGLLRMAERVVAERLSQDYVHEIRLGLMRGYLRRGTVKSLGVAVARTTNDLTSVKSWVTQGITPLVVGIPLVVGAGAALLLIDPWLMVALAVPLAVLGVLLVVLAPVAYARARRLRKARGRLAGHIADTVLSTTAIRSAGGSTRELKRVESHSAKMVAAAVRRATAAGALRGAAAATAGLTGATVVGTGLEIGLPTSHVAAALTIVGFLAAPVQDFGRAAEFRQTYRAARRIIAPAIDRIPHEPLTVVPRTPDVEASPGNDRSLVEATGLTTEEGETPLPALRAVAGDRVVLDTGDSRTESAILGRFVGLEPLQHGQILVGGVDMAECAHGKMRRLVGYGAQGMLLARTTILRGVAYRAAEPDADEAWRLLEAVGLLTRLAELPQHERTRLVQGGLPLSVPERARLVLARALYQRPPLLVFDRLDADLGGSGRAVMRTLLRDHPGVVVLASDAAHELVEPTMWWRPGGLEYSVPAGRTAAS